MKICVTFGTDFDLVTYRAWTTSFNRHSRCMTLIQSFAEEKMLANEWWQLLPLCSLVRTITIIVIQQLSQLKIT